MINYSRKSALFASTALVASLALPAIAQAADASEEIVVTARRVEERLQDIPVAVQVLNQKQLTDRNVVNAKDLATYTPSLFVHERFGKEAVQFTLRGLQQAQNTAPTTGIYFADVPEPRGFGNLIAGDAATVGEFYDLQNIQILKGPQGTLFGMNTTGGAVLLVPKKPTAQFGGYLEGTYGNYDQKRLQGVINVPLGSKARMRLGFDRMTQDGYLKNISGVGPKDFNDVDYIAGRASFVVDITPDLENYTIAHYIYSDNNGQSGKMGVCYNGVATSLTTLATSAASCDQLYRQNQSHDFYAVANAIPQPMDKMEKWAVINTTTWHVTDLLTVKNIASYAELRTYVNQDAFGNDWIIPPGAPNNGGGSAAGFHFSPNPIWNQAGMANSAYSTTTEELQFQGRSGNNKFTWQAGGFMGFADPLSNFGGGQNSPTGILCPNIGASPVPQCLAPAANLSNSGNLQERYTKYSYRDFAFYAQADFKITEKLTFTGGVRFTDDRNKGELWAINFPYTPNGFNAAAGVSCANAASNPATTSKFSLDRCHESFHQESHALTYMVSLNYKIDDDTMIYGKYSKGYRQGGVNTVGNDPFRTFAPERIDAYETGAKFSFHGRIPGFMNLAAFYSGIEKFQANLGFRDTFGSPGSPVNGGIGSNNVITILTNAGRARVWGAEADLAVDLFKNFRVDAAYAYTNTLLTRATPSSVPFGFNQLTVAPIQGAALPLVPLNKLSVTTTYTLPLRETLGKLSIGATYSYQDKYLISASPTPLWKQTIPSIATANVNLSWNNIAGGPVDLALFATNVTDTHYYTHANDQLASAGYLTYFLGPPRMYGMRVKLHFGAE